MDRILENISLDNLARLLVDIHIDSSKIMDSLLSNHQRDLLEMVGNISTASMSMKPVCARIYKWWVTSQPRP